MAQTVRLEVFSAEQGLSQGMIYDMLQDRQGYLWFGTRDGLNKYDGYNFQIFKNDPFNQFSISDNIITALCEDHNGYIWVGTETNGVDVLDPATGRFYHLSKGINGLSNQNILSLEEAPNGAMWVGTQEGLNCVTLPQILPSHVPDLSQEAITEQFFWEESTPKNPARGNAFSSLLVTDDGVLWIGTEQNAYRFDPKTQQKIVLPVVEKVDSKGGLKSNYFTKGPDGSVWLGQWSRIIHFEGDNLTIFPLPPTTQLFSSSITFDLEGNMFVNRRKNIYFYSKKALPPSPAQTFFSFPKKGTPGDRAHPCCGANENKFLSQHYPRTAHPSYFDP